MKGKVDSMRIVRDLCSVNHDVLPDWIQITIEEFTRNMITTIPYKVRP